MREAFATGPVDLGHVPSFSLGRIQVTPATRQVALGTLRETLEPRVMRVLVAVAEARAEAVAAHLAARREGRFPSRWGAQWLVAPG